MERDDLKKWLKEYHQDDRQWLADLCGKSLNTVYTWFSSRPVPKDAVVKIEAQMKSDRQTSAVPQNLVLQFTRSQFADICKAAAKRDEDAITWSERTLNEMAAYDLADLKTELSNFKAAEDPQPYANGGQRAE